MTIDKMIAVLRAHKEGKAIECRSDGFIAWVLVPHPNFDFSAYEYRVRPTPYERWEVLFPEGERMECTSKESAERCLALNSAALRIRHMREVTPS